MKLLMTCVVAIIITHHSHSMVVGDEQPLLSSPMKIEGAKVATLVDAKRIAVVALYKKAKSLDAMERIGNFSILDMGYDVPNFAEEGDKVWQAQVLRSAPRPNMYLGTIWIHSETEKVHFVAGYWDALKESKQIGPDVSKGARETNEIKAAPISTGKVN